MMHLLDRISPGSVVTQSTHGTPPVQDSTSERHPVSHCMESTPSGMDNHRGAHRGRRDAMLRRTGNTVQLGDAAMAEDDVASTSYSSTASSSSDSEPGGPQLRPGLQRLTLRETVRLGETRQDAPNAAH
ncbi:hypothetical protein V5799_011476 [Amblyomma americanum]|uniref:Uncharacterized protein n=1 Tax=Amblyomma americanum TaxID=6943 RepID=A0AAQ4EH65_AMBAM